MAVATGVADVVVCYRGFNERSGQRFGQVSVAANAQVNTNGLDNAWTYPMGLGTPAATVAMQARRYMHEYGATSEDFGRVAVADRRHAATNPNAFFYGKPITLEDHQASRMIAEPLHLLDCCQESDGAVAIVVVVGRAGPRPAAPAGVRRGGGAGQRGGPVRDDVATTATTSASPRWAWSAGSCGGSPGSGPTTCQTAVLYDHFTPYVLMQLEELGFCGRGEAPGFIADGAIELGGRLPLNTARRPARRGLHPRHERHRRGGPAGPRHVGQPGRRRAARAGHRRHRRAHQRADPLRLPADPPETFHPRSGRNAGPTWTSLSPSRRGIDHSTGVRSLRGGVCDRSAANRPNRGNTRVARASRASIPVPGGGVATVETQESTSSAPRR